MSYFQTDPKSVTKWLKPYFSWWNHMFDNETTNYIPFLLRNSSPATCHWWGNQRPSLFPLLLSFQAIGPTEFLPGSHHFTQLGHRVVPVLPKDETTVPSNRTVGDLENGKNIVYSSLEQFCSTILWQVEKGAHVFLTNLVDQGQVVPHKNVMSDVECRGRCWCGGLLLEKSNFLLSALDVPSIKQVLLVSNCCIFFHIHDDDQIWLLSTPQKYWLTFGDELHKVIMIDNVLLEMIYSIICTIVCWFLRWYNYIPVSFDRADSSCASPSPDTSAIGSRHILRNRSVSEQYPAADLVQGLRENARKAVELDEVQMEGEAGDTTGVWIQKFWAAISQSNTLTWFDNLIPVDPFT